MNGKVYFIGTGPGDPELITLKAWRIARMCDVVLYDSLVPDELVVLLPPAVEKIHVGKRGGRPSTPQAEINRMMVRFALEGKNVARLKGGDPIIFGRGGEEAAFLSESGVKFEIVPGVPSGIAAPTYVGIPCTDRNKASFVMFLTGHKAKEKTASTISWDWVAKARGGTLVIYMGVAEIGNIVADLVGAGMSPSMPAAVIERGTFPTQRCLTSTLENLPAVVKEHGVQPPAVFVIGEVVEMRRQLEWFSDRPLTGVRVLVMRAATQAEDTYRTLRELGAEVLPYPTISICEHIDDDAWGAFEVIDSEKRWLVFTSPNGVRYFMRQLVYRIGDLRHLALFSIAVVGEGTAQALREHGMTPDFIPSSATVADLAAEFNQLVDIEGAAIVRVRGDLADDTFEQKLDGAGVRLLPLTVYRTLYSKWPQDMKDKLLERLPDVMLFTSASTVDGLLVNLTDDEFKRLLSSARIFSIGPSTSARLRQYGFEVAVESPRHSISALIESLVSHRGEAG